MQRRTLLALLLVGAVTFACSGRDPEPAVRPPSGESSTGVTEPSTTTTAAAAPADPATTVATTIASTSTTNAADEDSRFAEARNDMVDRQIEGRGISDGRVLEAMRRTPRHAFVPDDYDTLAYADHPLPIGYGQTISQPYVVALMSQELGLEAGDRVLEIGTGSGYQAAVLADMGMEVFTIEIVPALAERAAADLLANGYGGVVTRQGDGYFGWTEHAPFDAVIVTAAPDHVPQPLVDQLAPGGRMVIPVGPIASIQTLWSFTRDAAGDLVAENLGPVMFVPLTRADDG